MYNYEINDGKRSYEAKKVTWIGFIVNTILTIIKIMAGIFGKSNAMLADGIHSLTDFFTDIVVLVGFRLTDKPADEKHNFGHGKYETFATLIIGLTLLFAGYSIMKNGLISTYEVLIKGETISSPGMIAIIAAILSIVFKEALYRYTKNIGERIKSPAVIANGWHHRSDAFSSIGTLIGISFAYFLGDKWTIFDPIAAIVVSVFIIKVSFEIMLPSVNELLEVSLNKDEIEYIFNLLNKRSEIKDFHRLRTRRVGSNVVIESHLLFDETSSLHNAHEVSESIEKQLKHYFGKGSIITFHLEPNIKRNEQND
jgi:cation diffusion facilitator family transporter